MKDNEKAYYSDVILIGTGIMSATLGTFLKKLEPDWTMRIFERMDRVAMESSEAWNNAGTGHSAFCELNYTPENTEEIIAQHHAKVYGKAKVGSPPMSVPHLDARMIDGQPALLFGPFAGFSTKFLKHGSFLDLPFSVKWGNIIPLVSAGIRNIPLTKYLVEQVTQSPEDRLEALLEYFPNAQMEDWTLQQAGQRVQVIKKDEKEGGVLEFGTEVVYAHDGSLATLLGASPGASTSVSIMLDVLSKCFPEAMVTSKWQKKLTKLIPSYGQSIAKDPELCRKTRARTSEILKLG